MISKLRESFRRDFSRLPAKIQQQAREAYRNFLRNPSHPSLAFKRLNTELPLWSVRITESYRAVGVRHGEIIIWFFIGTHAGI
jgi:hypothetical protein